MMREQQPIDARRMMPPSFFEAEDFYQRVSFQDYIYIAKIAACALLR